MNPLQFVIHHIFPREIMEGPLGDMIADIFAGAGIEISLDADGNKIALFHDPDRSDAVRDAIANGDTTYTDAGFGGGRHANGPHPGYNNFFMNEIGLILDDPSLSDAQKQSALFQLHQFGAEISKGTVTHNGSQVTINGVTAGEFATAYQDYSSNVTQASVDAYASNFDTNLTDSGLNQNNEARLQAMQNLLDSAYDNGNGSLSQEIYDQRSAEVASMQQTLADTGNINYGQASSLGIQTSYDVSNATGIGDSSSASATLTNAGAQVVADLSQPDPNTGISNGPVTSSDPLGNSNTTADAFMDSMSSLSDTLTSNSASLPNNLSDLGPATNNSMVSSFNSVIAGVGGGFIGDTAEFLNLAYDSIKTGINTGDWSDFGDAVATYGVSVVVSAALVAGTTALAGVLIGPTAAAVVGAAWAAYGIYDGLVNIAELAGKIYDDLSDNVGGWIDGLIDGFQDAISDSIARLRDPIVLDLDGDGVELLNRDESGVRFDFDGDGLAESSGWLGGDDGFLAIDLNRDGKINDITELFGDQFTSGFAAMAALDTNGDLVLDANDTQWNKLRIWKDANENGETDAGELRGMNFHDIESIDLRFTQVNFVAEANLISESGIYNLDDGTSRTIADVWFDFNNIDSRSLEIDSISARVEELPNLRGYGDIPDLHVAMDDSGPLRARVETLSQLNADQLTEAPGLIEDILFRWTDTLAVDQDGRGPNFDGRKLAVLEIVTGTPFDANGVTDPAAASVPGLNEAWDSLINSISARLLAQGPFQRYFAAFHLCGGKRYALHNRVRKRVPHISASGATERRFGKCCCLLVNRNAHF